jgi:predicted heme/steroid binding protein
VDLSEYAKTSSVLDYIDSACSSKLDTTSFSNVSGNFLTTSFGISESAHWEEATNAYEQASGTYLTSHQDLSDYQTIEGMTAYQPVGDYYSASNPSGFITGVDLTPYYTTADANTLSSMLSAAIDYVSANAGDEFPASANEAITAYQTNSGTYLTAISIPESASWNEVSTTVQTNSASWNDVTSKQDNLTFGYDGQDKISAINNSAIAGVGSLDIFPISGTGSVNVYEQNSVLWISGKDFTSDISYISGTIGDVETLLASL